MDILLPSFTVDAPLLPWGVAEAGKPPLHIDQIFIGLNATRVFSEAYKLVILCVLFGYMFLSVTWNMLYFLMSQNA